MDSQNASTINYVVIGVDLNFAKQAQQILSSLQASNPNLAYRVFPGADKTKLLEILNAHDVHSIMVEEEFLDTGPETWIKNFRESIKDTKNKDSPILFITTKTSVTYIKDLVKFGFSDVLIKPVDASLFIQKLSIANPLIKMTAEVQLFTMEAKQEVDLGFTFKTLSISEFGMTVQTDKALDLHAVISIYTTVLENPLAAQIRSVTKIADDNYKVFILFLGVNPADSQKLRMWIKQEYAQAKAAS